MTRISQGGLRDEVWLSGIVCSYGNREARGELIGRIVYQGFGIQCTQVVS